MIGFYFILFIFISLILLIIFIFILIIRASKKKNKIKEKVLTLDGCVKILKDKDTTKERVDDVLNIIIQKYAKIGIDAKVDIYKDIIISICHHLQITSKIILDFDKKLVQINPKYKKEINKAIKDGLNSRNI